MSLTASASIAGVQRDIEYSRPAGVPLQLDASVPAGEGPFPAAILVHGGGWVRGNRRAEVAPLFQPLTDAGIAWFSISYRLATDPIQFGVAIHDVEAAIRFVKSHAAEYNIDPARVALIGESAGGQLAAMAAINKDPDLRVKAVVALYAPTDLVSLAKSSSLIPAAIRDNLRGTPWEGLLLARLAQLSPIENIRANMPPFLLIHGTNDPLVPIDQSRAMCDRMQTAGNSCQVYPVAGAGHGIRWWESNAAISAPYKGEIVRWLKKQFESNLT
jgi:alpha-L-fucosidase 2